MFKSIADLVPDNKNANRGTARGRKAVRDSLQKLGAGRSIVVDRNGRIIAGNKTAEGAKAAGLENVITVETDGSQLVAVVRTDLDLDDPKARELAIADNRTAELGLEWDGPVLKDLAADLDLKPYFTDEELKELLPPDPPQQQQQGEDDVPDLEDAVTQEGDLWILGRYRLLCADGTQEQTLERLLNGNNIQMVFTDPPYGVEIVNVDGKVSTGLPPGPALRGKVGSDDGDGLRFARAMGKVGGDKVFGTVGNNLSKTMRVKPIIEANKYAPIIGDDSTETAIKAYNLCATIKPTPVLIFWGGNYYASALPDSSCWIVFARTTFAARDSALAVRSDNLVKNGDFDQGSANWHLTDSTGTGSFVTATDYPRGTHSFEANAVANVLLRSTEFIPVDTNKTYYMETWIKIPAPGSLVLAGFTEYDGNQTQLTRSGSFAYCLTPSGITSTTGNNWQYFAAEVTGNSATPSVTQFLNTAKFIRPMFLINWSGTTTNQQVQVLGVRLSEVAAGHTRALRLLQQGISTDLNKQGSIAPGQSFTISWSTTSTSISLSWSSATLLRADGSSLSVSSGTQSYSSLSSSTQYWIYAYIGATTGTVGFANGNPPPTSASSTLAIQAAFDGRIALLPFSITTPSSGNSSGSGGDGSCPDFNELVEVQEKGTIRAADVEFGDYIKGYSFETHEDVFRRVIGKAMKSCSAWRIVQGHKVSPCEPVFLNHQWIGASRVPGAPLDTSIGIKMDLVVEADDFNQHNYWLVSGTPLLIHNPVLPRS